MLVWSQRAGSNVEGTWSRSTWTLRLHQHSDVQQCTLRCSICSEVIRSQWIIVII